MQNMKLSLFALVAVLLIGPGVSGCTDASRDAVSNGDGFRAVPKAPVEIIIKHPADGSITKIQSGVIDKALPVLRILSDLKQAGKLKYVGSGKANQILIESINGTANEGARGKNWMYALNGSLANQGVATQQAKPGDKITWCFIKYENRKKCGLKDNSTEK